MLKRTKGEKVFNAFNIAFLILLCIITIYPLYYVFICAFSDGAAVVSGDVLLYPVKPTLSAVRRVFKIEYFLSSLGNSVFYTVAGTIVSIIVTTMGSYTLSRKRVIGRHAMGLFISFTMWFSAGIIPAYLNFDSLNLINTRASLIFGFAVNAFYVILMRSYFDSLPVELEEAAKMDGMGDFGIFLKIMLPMSTPMLATIVLYCALDRWNSYFWAMILLKSEKLIPLQVLLRKIIVDMQVLDTLDVPSNMDYSRETVIYATIAISIIPSLVVYPFIQKYFVKGITIGSVKG
ncbi:carbohydrate ABC transporter permease [Anaerocolumna sp. MB42-C2]|uniref:carbohydrate ABC transporter permease n=1 Tax=Anaerocolumna sp. MB42-C2 TaxID=3070997 RepID=UPI0027E15228|nr:carbohydrate ABC transporter permease [Anaerocolumna sp. MB42-C2]WMJ85841.1 carbohydrate ABC transporter permease [Anaerocolumna sp. MB42-C2]